jgi:S1-C subfamily serine protease
VDPATSRARRAWLSSLTVGGSDRPQGSWPPDGDDRGDRDPLAEWSGELPEEHFDDPVAPGGWMPPAARAWVHPSELGPIGRRLRKDAAGGPFAGRPGRWSRSMSSVRSVAWRIAHPRPAVVSIVGLAGAVAIAGTLTLVELPAASRSGDQPSQGVASATTVGAVSGSRWPGTSGTSVDGSRSGPSVQAVATTLVDASPGFVALTDRLERSLAVLRVRHGRDWSTATAVALPDVQGTPQQLAVTAYDAVVGAQALRADDAAGASGDARVVGADERAGIALVQLPFPLAQPQLASTPVEPGDVAAVVGLAAPMRSRAAGSAARAVHAPIADVAFGIVLGEGAPGHDDRPGSGPLDALEADMPLPPGALGSVLVGPHGGIEGVLAWQASHGRDPLDVFSPSALAFGEALALAEGRGGVHGFLGVVATDAHAGGAIVMEVPPGTPAAHAGLEPGDVIVALGASPVRSAAELRALVYVTKPGTQVAVSVVRNGRPLAFDVTLGSTLG